VPRMKYDPSLCSDLKRAQVSHPVLPAIAFRWSPRAFDPERSLEESDVLPLLEAARWAASANNLQPWRMPWALRGETAFERILRCLNPANASWARRAGALLVGCAVVTKSDGSRNRHASHDLGQALAQMAVQAAASGIAMHQMAGFNTALARTSLEVPEDIEPFTAVALGWPGAPGLLAEDQQARELAPRERYALPHIAPRGGWGELQVAQPPSGPTAAS